jgi:thioredoxin 1
MAPIELTAENFDEIVLNSQDKPVFVDFWAVWCVPCLMVAPVIEEVAEEVEGRAVVAKLHIEDVPEIAQRYSIMSIPTVLIFYKGEIVKQFIGIQEKETYIEALKPYMPAEEGSASQANTAQAA